MGKNLKTLFDYFLSFKNWFLSTKSWKPVGVIKYKTNHNQTMTDVKIVKTVYVDDLNKVTAALKMIHHRHLIK